MLIANNKKVIANTYSAAVCMLMAMLAACQMPIAIAADTPAVKKAGSPSPPGMPPFVRRGPTTVKFHTPKLAFSQNPTDKEILAVRVFSEPLVPTYAFLLSITDQIGLVSKFAYDTSSNFVTSVTTPYGTTSFYRYTPAKASIYLPTGLRMSFPDGTSCVVENWKEHIVETFYWDREAMNRYPNDAANSINPVYSSTYHCAVTQWQLESAITNVQSAVPNWYQPALAVSGSDAKISYYYDGSTFLHDGDHYSNGPSNKPNTVTKNGSVWAYTYNTFGHMTQSIDPAGRTFSYTYAANNIDLTQAKQTRASNTDFNGQWTYNAFSTAPTAALNQHLPLSFINGSGQQTLYSYNAYAQPTQVCDTQGNIWNYTYSSITGNPLPVYLTQIDGPLSGNQDVTTFSYDGYGRVYQATNSTGYTLTYSYDLADRITQVTYPDGTSDQIVYDKLDQVLLTDRLGRTTHNAYDSMDQLVSTIDPLGRKTKYAWCGCGALMCLTDPAGHTTMMHHDLEGRLSSKVYADGTEYSYTYNASGLLQNRTDALEQVTSYTYNSDFSLAQTSYSNVVNPTSPVFLTYDPNYPRVTNRQNNSSGLSYAYNPYIKTANGIATLTLGGTPTAGDVVSVTVANTTATNVSLSGTPTTGDVVNVLVLNSNLSGGKYNLQYTVQAGDTTPTILASSIATAINGDGTLSAEDISATSTGSTVKVAAFGSTGVVRVLSNTNGTVTETVGGSINAGDVVSVTVFDAGIPTDTSSGLPAGQRTYAYTVGGGDSTSDIADQLATAINADATLTGLGITANWSASNSFFTITSLSENQTQYAQTVTPAGNETITLTGGPSELATNVILPSSSTTVNYTVQGGDTTLTILADSIKDEINADTTLDNYDVAATSNASAGVIYLTAPASFGIPTVTVGVSGGATETITTAVTGNVYFAGTPTTNNRVNVTVFNNTLTGGSRNVQYIVQSGDTTATLLAASVAAAINADSTLSAAQISATASSGVVTITSPTGIGTVNIIANTNGTVTETITFAGNLGESISITAYDAAIPGGQKTESYTPQNSDTATTIAAALAAKVNTDLTAYGITATSSSGVVSLRSSSANGTVYKQAATGTSTITQGGGSTSIVTAGGPFGGGKLAATANSAISNSTTTYLYDSLGRNTNRSINGSANSTTWAYDEIDRVTSEVNPMGTFTYAYLNNTGGSSKGDPRLSSVTYPNSQSATFKYLPNIGDQRLQQIVNANPSAVMVSQFNHAYDPAGQMRQWQQQQNSTNIHNDYDYDLAGQLVSAQNDSGSSFKAYISGSVNPGDVVTVTAYDASLTGTVPVGQETASYTVMGGDTASTIATALASDISSTMSNISVTASATGSVITINTDPDYTTSFTCEVTGVGATDTISLSQSQPIQPLHKQLYYAYDKASNIVGVQGDSSGSFPSGLTTTAAKASYDCVNQLTSVKAGGPIAVGATTVNPIKSAVINVSQTATIGGTIQAGDVLYISVHDSQLPTAEIISYTVVGGNTPTSIATSFASAVNGNTTLSTLGVTATSAGAVVTISSSSTTKTSYTQATSPNATETITLSDTVGVTAKVSPSNTLAGSPTLAASLNTVSVTAVSGGGTPTTNTYPITISTAPTKSFSSDANGNMTNVNAGTYPQYSYDAENRLIQIAYDGNSNSTNMAYDAAGHRSQMTETYNGAVLSTNNFVWCGNEICEARLADSSLWRQYFTRGQINFTGSSGTNYFYNLDHLGSVKEVVDGGGTIISQTTYDPYGIRTNLQGNIFSDFGYAGMYQHQRSGLNLTMYRAYSPTLGRWLSRDPLGEALGVNLYYYVRNNPINSIDSLGLWPKPFPFEGSAKRKLPGMLKKQVPCLSDEEAAELAKSIIKQLDWPDVKKATKVIPKLDMSRMLSPFVSNSERRAMFPSSLDQLTPQQSEVIDKFLDTLPPGNESAIEKVKQALPTYQPVINSVTPASQQ